MSVFGISESNFKVTIKPKIMETTLTYAFRRKSENHLDWLLNIVKSEKYFQAESYIVNHSNQDSFR
jgi:hypothetical protein